MAGLASGRLPAETAGTPQPDSKTDEVVCPARVRSIRAGLGRRFRRPWRGRWVFLLRRPRSGSGELVHCEGRGFDAVAGANLRVQLRGVAFDGAQADHELFALRAPACNNSAMPRYDFKCASCGLQFEVSRPISQATDPAQCPQDGTAADRVFTMPMTFVKGDPNAPPADTSPAAGGDAFGHGHSHGPGGHSH